MIQQTTVFVENRPGRLTDILRVLAEHKIDLNGISIADSEDFGFFRMILSDPEKGQDVLKKSGYIVKSTDVLAIDVHDTPGGLLHALESLAAKGINVQYMYAFGTKLSSRAMIIMKTDDNKRSTVLLKEIGVDVLSLEEVEKRLTV